jgi:hypothetical protein
VIAIDTNLLVYAHRSAIWDTEWGYSSTWFGGDGHASLARRAQAELVLRELLTAWAVGFPLARLAR